MRIELRMLILPTINFFFAPFIFGLALRAQDQPTATAEIPSTTLDNLVQGRVYQPVYANVVGSQYLIRTLSTGEILYREKMYQNLPMWYDIYADDLIYLMRQDMNVNRIRLPRDFIREFELDTRQFINSSYGRYANIGLDMGYYEILFEDRVTLLAKRNINVVTRDSVPHFIRADGWFLVINGKAHRIHNKKSFMEAVGNESKDEMSRFSKIKKIRWRKAEDAEWVLLAKELNASLID